MPNRAAVIGLDGAAWHLLDPFLSEGAMPQLARLVREGASGTLLSTVPTYTPPAWTSAATGVNPGRHGIYGFHMSNAQHDEIELAHSGKIVASTIWEMANSQGARVGMFNLPLTYPPQPLDGWMVSGMMTPSYGHRLKGFVYPSELEERIDGWVPDYLIEIPTNWETDWRDEALCKRAIDSLHQRSALLRRLLENDPPDLVFSVLETPDRLQHAYYRFMDPKDELYSSKEAERLRPWLVECFSLMDEFVGILVDFAGSGGTLVCSDHGFTAWENSVHTNTLLEKWGYLRFKRSSQLMRTKPARALVPLAKRILPAKAAREAKRRTFAAIDWSRTRAFASPIPQQGIYINAAGREPHGTVAEADVARLKDEIAERFASLRGPDGASVTDKVWRSEDVFHGEQLRGAPDLLPVLRDHRFELDDEVFHREVFTDQSHLPRGVHHPDGIVVVNGNGVKSGARTNGSVNDVTPTLLYLAGLGVPEGLDGRVLTDAFDPERLRAQPVSNIAPLEKEQRDATSPYSKEEEALIEESLRGLGYL